MGVRTSVDLKLDPSAAFEAVVDELKTALARLGMDFQPEADGQVTEGSLEVGRVARWRPPKEIVIEWHSPGWQAGEATRVALRFSPAQDGTRVTLEHKEWYKVLGDQGNELAGWFSSELAAPFLSAMAPSRLGDWVTDRRARRPSGPQARAFYRDPIYHRPNFKAILAVLRLTDLSQLRAY